MRTDDFVMRGRTSYNSAKSAYEPETLNFSGYKPGMAYKLTEFVLFPSTNIGAVSSELCGAITASKTAADAANPNFNDDGLIGTFVIDHNASTNYGPEGFGIVNDTFLITQNLLLSVEDTSGNNNPVNWHCKFKPVKMAKAEEAVANYKQFMISDE